MELCKICDKEFKSIKSLAMHVKRTHGMSSEDYYIKYMGSIGICKCGKLTKFRNMAVGYSTYCSSKCAYHSDIVTKKRESTMLAKYGSIKAGNSSSIRESIRSTVRNKYGVDSIGSSSTIQTKIQNTVYNRYGVKSVLSLESIQNKIKETNLIKYGTEYAMQNEIIKCKASNTCMLNNGVAYPGQSPEIRKKQIKTNIDRYGVDVPTKSPEIRAKVIQTNLNKYGYETPLQNDIIKRKSYETCMNKYGVSHPGLIKSAHKKRNETVKFKYGVDFLFQSNKIKEKIKNTLISRYGVDNITKLDYIKDQIKSTNLIKYGVECTANTPHAINARHYNKINRMIDKYSIALNNSHCEIIDTFNNGTMVKYKCNVCGNIIEESWQFFIICRLNNNITPCTICEPKKKSTSFKEDAIFNYIKSINSTAIQSNRSILYPKELDIYIPDKHIAFEFNGLHYHSELYKNSTYHLDKTESCLKLGIHLIHIYEDDWIYKQNIVKSRIRNILGKSDRIYARKCEVRLVNSKISGKFLDENHMQGKCRSSYKIGLYFENELVSLMTFGKSRFSNEYELIRFCNKLNISVVGGAGKLFKYFITHYPVDDIISYADRSWSTGNLYINLGFIYDSTTHVGYSYVNGDIRENRMKYQKHKLVNAGYDKNMTEHEIMLSRKMYRIYDSGNLKYRWIR